MFNTRIKAVLFLLVFGLVLLTIPTVFAQGEDVVISDVAESNFLAEAQCEINGQPVPCDQLTESIGGFLGWGIAVVVVLFLVGIAAFIFWIVMLVHAASHPVENKAMWIILMVFTGVIGSLIYYFVVKRKFAKQIAQQGPSANQSAK